MQRLINTCNQILCSELQPIIAAGPTLPTLGQWIDALLVNAAFKCTAPNKGR